MTITRSTLLDVPLSRLRPYDRNPRKNDPAVEAVAKSLAEFGYVKVSVGIDEENVLLYGHTTLKAMKRLGWSHCPEVTKIDGLTDPQKQAYRLADNRLAELAEWDGDLLLEELMDLAAAEFDVAITGFDPDEWLPESCQQGGGGPSIEAARKSLAERFLIPPFSVLDARQGYWQERKRAWLALGIKSELGRGENLTISGKQCTTENLNYYRNRANAEPGGSPRPAADYARSHARGDGHGRPMKPKMELANDPMQRVERYKREAA